jgi:hypothetical protein
MHRAFGKCSTSEERWEQYYKVLEKLKGENKKVRIAEI